MQPRPYVGQTPVTPGWAGALRDEGVPEAPVRPSPTSHSQRRRFLEPRGPREGADGDTWGGGGPWGGLLAADARVRPGSAVPLSPRTTRNP